MNLLLERDPMLAQLDALREDAASGRGALVFVSGEAGIGKTALLNALRARVGAPARVWWGHCDPLQTPAPLAPLRDMLAQMPRDLRAPLRDLLRGEGARIELFAAFLDTLAAAPTIAIFEDVHWADEATRDLLRYLGRRVQHTHALLIATHRDDELGPGHPLRIVLGDLATSGARRITLPPLSLAAVCRLVGDLPLDAAALHRVSGGNPFLVTEVAAGGGGHGVPASVRDAALARTSRLGESARSVLETAAVIGTRVEIDLLACLSGAEAASIDDAVAAGVLQHDGDRVLFRHELIRDALLAVMPPARRHGLHRLVLQALSARADADPAALAHHAEGARDAAAVLEHAPCAAAQASAVGAHREASAQCERALRFAAEASPARRAELLEASAVEHTAIGRLDAAIAERRQAIALWQANGDRLRVGANLARLVPMLVNAGRNDEAELSSREALALLQALPPGRELAIALRTQAFLRMLCRDNDAAVRVGEQAIALAESLGDIDTLALANNATGAALMVGTDLERGRTMLRRSQALARQAGNDMAALSAVSNMGSASGELHRFVEAATCLEEAAAFGVERELDCSYELGWLALCRLRLGEWSRAGELAERARAMNPERAITRTMAWLATGRLRARRGDPGVWDALDEALRLAQASGHLQRLAPVHAARAEAAWLGGEAGRAFDEASAVFDLACARSHAWFVAELGFWRWRAGGAATLDGVAASMPYVLQMTGDWSGAAAAWEALACPYEQAGALADGDAAAQRAALAIAERLGALPAARRLRNAMRAQGQHAVPRGPRASTQANVFGLTAREREVLDLLAEGLTNAQVAARRHLSVRTVDHHVAAILAKLGVASRAEAVQSGQRSGLLATPPR